MSTAKRSARPLSTTTIAACRAALRQAEAVIEQVGSVTCFLLFDDREALLRGASRQLEYVRRRTLGATCQVGRELAASRDALHRVWCGVRDEHERPELIGPAALEPCAARMFATIARLRMTVIPGGDDGDAMRALYQVINAAWKVTVDYHRCRASGVNARVEVEGGVLVLQMPAKRRVEVRRAA